MRGLYGLKSRILLACVGILLTGILLVRKVTGALLIGIMLTTLAGIPIGVTHIDNIASLPHSLAPRTISIIECKGKSSYMV